MFLSTLLVSTSVVQEENVSELSILYTKHINLISVGGCKSQTPDQLKQEVMNKENTILNLKLSN